ALVEHFDGENVGGGQNRPARQHFCPLQRIDFVILFLAFRGRYGIPAQESLTNAPTTVLAISTSSRADLRPASRRVYDRASADFARDVSSAGWSAIRTVVVAPSDC